MASGMVPAAALKSSEEDKFALKVCIEYDFR
jgi:hypothetical protein